MREPAHWFKTRQHDTRTMHAGDRILMPDALAIETYIESIPAGELRDVKRLRDDLARQYDAAVTCPVTTRIVLADLISRAVDAADPLPVWTVIGPKDTVLKHTPHAEWVLAKRAAERPTH